MNNQLQKYIDEAAFGLSILESIPIRKWKAIGRKCGPQEISEIHQRINKFRIELEQCPEWDGDTQDNINHAIYRYSILLEEAAPKKWWKGWKERITRR